MEDLFGPPTEKEEEDHVSPAGNNPNQDHEMPLPLPLPENDSNGPHVSTTAAAAASAATASAVSIEQGHHHLFVPPPLMHHHNGSTLPHSSNQMLQLEQPHTQLQTPQTQQQQQQQQQQSQAIRPSMNMALLNHAFRDHNNHIIDPSSAEPLPLAPNDPQHLPPALPLNFHPPTTNPHHDHNQHLLESLDHRRRPVPQPLVHPHFGTAPFAHDSLEPLSPTLPEEPRPLKRARTEDSQQELTTNNKGVITSPLVKTRPQMNQEIAYENKNTNEKDVDNDHKKEEGNNPSDSTTTIDNSKQTKKPRNRRETDYTAAQRMRILDELSGPKPPLQKAVAEKYGIGLRTLQRWIKNRSEIVKQVEQEGKGSLKRRHEGPLDRVKLAVKTFYELNLKQPASARVPITGTVIAQKGRQAKEAILAMNAKEPFLTQKEVVALQDFRATESWARKTAQKFGWRKIASQTSLHNRHAMKQELDQIRELVVSYGPERCYNMGEAVLYYKLLPLPAYAVQQAEGWAPQSPLMTLDDRATLYVCTNATGTDKIPLAWIGSSKQRPACFQGREMPFAYYTQNRGWSDTKTLTEWWRDFLQHIRARTTEKVLLLLDYCGPLGVNMVDPQEQVRVVFFPANCAAKYTPMQGFQGGGVIGLLKRHYRYELLNQMLRVQTNCAQLRKVAQDAQLPSGTMGLDQGQPPHVRDAMMILSRVWSGHLAKEVVTNCWKKTSLWAENDIAMQVTNDSKTQSRKRKLDSDTKALVQSVVNFAKQEKLQNDGTLEMMNFAHYDRDNGMQSFDHMLEQMARAIPPKLVNVPHFQKLDAAEKAPLYKLMEDWVNLEDSHEIKQWMSQELGQDMTMQAMLDESSPELLAPDDSGTTHPLPTNTDQDMSRAMSTTPLTTTNMSEIQAMATQLLKYSVQLSRGNPQFHAAAAQLQDVAVSVQQTQTKLDHQARVVVEPRTRGCDGVLDNIYRA